MRTKLKKATKRIFALLLAVMTVFGSMSFNGMAMNADAADSDTYEASSKVKTLLDSMEVPELGQTGRFWTITLDGINAFCLNFGGGASSGVSYTSSEYCTNDAVNRACEHFFNGEMNDETYIMTQGFIWAVLDGKDPYGTIAQIEIALHGDYSEEVVLDFVDGVNSTTPTMYYNVFYSGIPGDQPLVMRVPEAPFLEIPKYAYAQAEADYTTTNNVSINMYKMDDSTGSPLEGVTFDFYVDFSFVGTATTDSNGHAAASYSEDVTRTATGNKLRYCTNWDDLEAPQRAQVSAVTPYITYDAAYNDSYALAVNAAKTAAQTAATNVTHTYKAVETKARINYYLNSSNATFTKVSTGGGAVDLNVVNTAQKGEITLTKNDSVTGNPLSGAVYELYASSDIVHPDGMTRVIYTKDSLVGTFLATGSNGKSVLNNLYLGSYYVKEITAPAGYLINDTKTNVSLTYAGQSQAVSTSSVSTNDEYATGKVTIKKDDSERVTAQGDATLKGAKYGLYAAEDITHPDGHIGVLFSKDELVKEFPAIDENGSAYVDGLYLGKYFVKEISPSEGYLLDNTKYTVDVLYVDQNTAVVTKAQTVKEDVIKGNIKITKHMQYFDTVSHLTPQKPEKDAEFEIRLKSSYVLADTVKTDEDGFAISADLPYGTYIVHQTKGAAGCDFVNDFEVEVTEDGKAYSYILENPIFYSLLKIVKTDSETEKTVAIKDTSFQIYNEDAELVEMTLNYPIRHKISTFKTDENGEVTLPKELVYGKYKLVETDAPEGYTINDPITFEVKKDNAVKTDDGANVVIIEYKDDPVKGVIKVEKTGVVLTGYSEDEKDFIYEDKGIENVKFEVKAAEDVLTPDNQKGDDGNRNIICRKDEVVDTITTTSDGKGESKKLPLGKYTVEEISTPDGLLIDKEVRKAELKYKDEVTKIVYKDFSVYNKKQDFSINIKKVDSKNYKQLGEAEFTLYANRNIVNKNGTVIADKGKELGTVKSTKIGYVSFDKNLPLNVYAEKLPLTDHDGNTLEYSSNDYAMYYFVETKAPDGYDTTDAKIYITGNITDNALEKINADLTITNDPTTKIEISKKDGTTKDFVLDAELKLQDEYENTVKSWTTKGEPMYIERLAPGTYTLIETNAPDGYSLAEPITFTVEDTNRLQRFEMVDDRANISLMVEKSTIRQTQSGDTYKYVVDTAHNNSACSLENFSLTDFMPNDTKLETLYTGTWNDSTLFDVYYTTNNNKEWKIWKKGLCTDKINVLQVSELVLSGDEFIEEYQFRFGTVKRDFACLESPYYTVIVDAGLDLSTELLSDIVLTGEKFGLTFSSKDNTITTLWGDDIIIHAPQKDERQIDIYECNIVDRKCDVILTGDSIKILKYIMLLILAIIFMVIIYKTKKKQLFKK